MTVADEGDMFALGVVEGDAEDFAGVSGALEDGAEEGVLVAIDGWICVMASSWHAKIPC